MRAILANDHGGLTVRPRVLATLADLGVEVHDMGVATEQSVDYPDMAETAATEFLKGGYNFGILICGTGIGISIAANKIKGIRCALLYDNFSAQMAKEHNNANFIAFGGRVHYHEPIEEILSAYVRASFAGGRHEQRVLKIENLEKKNL